MDLKPADLVRVVAEKWKLVLTCAGVFGVLALAVSLIAPATYQASAVILVKPKQVIETKAEIGGAVPGQHEQVINSIAHLVRSNEVMRLAIDAFGAERLYPGQTVARLSDRFWALRQSLRHEGSGNSEAVGDAKLKERITYQVWKALAVGVEPKTNLITVTFTHRDRQIASEFMNTLLVQVRAKTNEQGVRDEIAAFLTDQKAKYDQAYEASVKAIANYSDANSIFSVAEQRRLMLERESALRTAAQLTSSTIVEKQNQAAELSEQLKTIYPLAKYPQIDRIVQAASGGKKRRNVAATDDTQVVATSSNDTKVPLLLIKVYQDTIQALVKLQAEIAGLIALKEQQVKDVETMRNDLQQLGQKSVTFERMQLEAQQSREAAAQYATYATKEKLQAEASRQGLSIIDVVQPAMTPFDPVFPNPVVLVPFGVIAGAALGLALALAGRYWPLEMPFQSIARQEVSLQWPLSAKASKQDSAKDVIGRVPQPAVPARNV